MARQGSSSNRKTRAAEFASKFGPCAVHRREARSVHCALEELAKGPLPDLDPEATLADLLPAASGVLSASAHDPIAGHEYATLAQVVSRANSSEELSSVMWVSAFGTACWGQQRPSQHGRHTRWALALCAV